jgi:general secretion pathway protein G
MMVVAILATLATIGMTNFISYRERTTITICITDLKNIERTILVYTLDNNSLPSSLQQAGLGIPLDPWGNPYVYNTVDSVPPGKRRKDKSLVPINTDYDLYSSGPDGKSVAPLTAKASRDDIVRANNGSFIGPARNY